jgi:hypothetical protein
MREKRRQTLIAFQESGFPPGKAVFARRRARQALGIIRDPIKKFQKKC